MPRPVENGVNENGGQDGCKVWGRMAFWWTSASHWRAIYAWSTKLSDVVKAQQRLILELSLADLDSPFPPRKRDGELA